MAKREVRAIDTVNRPGESLSRRLGRAMMKNIEGWLLDG
jgi:hypothetical protein